MVADSRCPFCLIVGGEDRGVREVMRDGRTVAFFPLNPATRGHTVVVPDRHVAHFADLIEPEVHELGEAVQRVAKAIRASLAPDGLNIIQSNGEAATQSVPHVHFHIVPRWAGDTMGLHWPKDTAEDGPAQDLTLALIQASLPPEEHRVSAEDRRQHLSFIQAVITRMSQASSSSKTWLLPIITVTYGYAISAKSSTAALLGCLAVIVFGTLDANYLKQERAFRKLYDDVTAGRDIPAFAMNPALAAPAGSKGNYWPDGPDVRSWAVAPVYGPMLLVGLGVAIWLLCR